MRNIHFSLSNVKCEDDSAYFEFVVRNLLEQTHDSAFNYDNSSKDWEKFEVSAMKAVNRLPLYDIR